MRRAQSELRKWRGEARVVAKIERHEALDNLAGILAVTDAVMVARGDLAWKWATPSSPDSRRPSFASRWRATV